MTTEPWTSIVLQEPLEIIELDLRTLRVAQTAAKLFQNPPPPLHIDLTGNLHRQIVAVVLAMLGSSHWIALPPNTQKPTNTNTQTIALAVAILLLHGVRAG